MPDDLPFVDEDKDEQTRVLVDEFLHKNRKKMFLLDIPCIHQPVFDVLKCSDIRGSPNANHKNLTNRFQGS
jgi:hypothetical protein